MFLLQFAVASGASAAEKGGKQRYLKAILIENTQAGVIDLTYDIACGETFNGVVVKETREAVALGIMVTRTDKICSTLPESVTTKIAVNSKKSVRSLIQGADKVITLGEVKGASIEKGSLSVSWQKCGHKVFGIVLGLEGGGDVAIQLAQEAGNKTAQRAVCESSLKRTIITSIKLSEQSKVRIVKLPGNLEQLYAMRVVKPVAVFANSGNSLEVTWTGSCQEKYVGMVFTGDRGAKVGLLTMIAPNVKCAGSTSKVINRARLDGLVVSQGARMKPVDAQELQALNDSLSLDTKLLSLKKLHLSRYGDGLASGAESEPGCVTPVAAVMTNDAYGNVSAALLGGPQGDTCLTSSSSINGNIQRLSLSAEPRGPMPQVFDLKVFGTSLN
jgi:hypothetical protein